MTALEELGREASLALDGELVPMDRRSHVYSVDLRYQGQNYEINIALSQAMLDMLASGDSQAIMDRFNGQHQVTYGYQLTGRAVQIVNLRVTAIGIDRKSTRLNSSH